MHRQGFIVYSPHRGKLVGEWEKEVEDNKFKTRSFMWQRVLNQQVLIDSKFYVATSKQIFFYKAASLPSEDKGSIFYLW